MGFLGVGIEASQPTKGRLLFLVLYARELPFGFHHSEYCIQAVSIQAVGCAAFLSDWHLVNDFST